MIRWFAKNGVAANLLMIFIAVFGWHALQNRVVFEIFPEFEAQRVQVALAYRGATPAEIEEAMVVKVEEAIADLDGLKEIQSSSAEGSGRVYVEVERRRRPSRGARGHQGPGRRHHDLP